MIVALRKATSSGGVKGAGLLCWAASGAAAAIRSIHAKVKRLMSFMRVPEGKEQQWCSRQQLVDDAGAGDRGVGQRLVAAVVRVGQLVVVEAQLVQNRGQQVGTAHPAFDRAVAEFVGVAVDVAGS